ncbi:sugar transferase [Colwellia sp. E2M01]|uniref:sugar transferase n=1 Tax=Colwellia sp. E2M01 TaxID=2841561 RepID=UPI001C091FE8|nr:sugar transferase [Colwellia sp. E2M01]MBU2869210.1 sugar transferase [Colwellia sp. E2M01]
MTQCDKFIKRIFDIIVSFIGLIITLPVILISWLISAVETSSNGFFIQKRVGKNGKLFNVIKIKTMRKVSGVNTSVTTENDVRITNSGVFFRKTKIDELPQLWNVLIGQMSFVGPRPDVPGYADVLTGKDRLILSIRPGITGPASIKYKDEEALLAKQEHPESYNRNVIWPDKVDMNLSYIKYYSFVKDVNYIWKTIVG